MQKIIIYCFSTFLILILVTSCNQDSLPSLRETFSKKDKIPFGTYIVYNQLEQLFYRNTIHDKKQNFETLWREISDTASLYISISKNLYLSRADKEAMLAYVGNGNIIFISSENIDKDLLDTLFCSVTHEFFLPPMKYTGVRMKPGPGKDSAVYRYYFFPFYDHFSKYDQTRAKVLAVTEDGSLANYIVIFYGKGRFFLHCEPRALGNYFLLQRDNYKYLQNIFSFLPEEPEHVFWDDFYCKRNYPVSEEDGKTGLGALLQYPSLARAFWLLLLLLALYILFGGKRRQRILPIIPPNKNTTLDFTETVGRLYLQKKDNRNIADKMITYFLEHIRNQYFLNTNYINNDFITTLSRKSMVSLNETETLFKTINQVHNSLEISDQQLLSLNHQIENFYKNKT